MASENAYVRLREQMEPDTEMVPPQSISICSIAVSLKRIANVLERVEARLTPAALFEIAKDLRALIEADDNNSNQDIQR